MIQKIRMTDLYDTLLEHEDLQSFSNCLREAGLHLALRMMGPLTILAFTNRALEALPAMIRIMLDTDRDFLTAIMMRHIVRGDWSGLILELILIQFLPPHQVMFPFLQSS